jgi:hypothetical protein
MREVGSFAKVLRRASGHSQIGLFDLHLTSLSFHRLIYLSLPNDYGISTAMLIVYWTASCFETCVGIAKVKENSSTEQCFAPLDLPGGLTTMEAKRYRLGEDLQCSKRWKAL